MGLWGSSREMSHVEVGEPWKGANQMCASRLGVRSSGDPSRRAGVHRATRTRRCGAPGRM